MTQLPEIGPLAELPLEATDFVGRGKELAALGAALNRSRLVTVTGPGGVGKTRLSLRAARQAGAAFPQGAYWVELSALSDPELLPYTVASALGLAQGDAVSPMEAVVRRLRTGRSLLVLDTCEHLVDACAILAETLLRHAAGVTVLATSRQSLSVSGEHVLSIDPLPVRADGGDALELFTRRALSAAPGLVLDETAREQAVELCRSLDGMPLAIELAAVRLRTLPLSLLIEHFANGVPLLARLRGGTPRHQTLRAAIDWSFGLCSEAEQALWARLSVFSGPFDFAAARYVCTGGILDPAELVESLVGLVDKSVLIRDGDWYRMLDMIREYGAELAHADDSDDTLREAHARYYAKLAESFDRKYMSDGHMARHNGLRQQDGQLRAALEHSLAAGHHHQAAELARSLWRYWFVTGRNTEGRYWCYRVAEHLPRGTAERAWVLGTNSFLAALQADPEAYNLAREATAIAAAIDDPALEGRAYQVMQLASGTAGRLDEAHSAAARSAPALRAANDRAGELTLEAQSAFVRVLSGDPGSALEMCGTGLRQLAEGRTETGWLHAAFHWVQALALFETADYDASTTSATAALHIEAAMGDVSGAALNLEVMAWVAARTERLDEAAWLLGAADAQWQRLGGRLIGNPVMEQQHQTIERELRELLPEDRYLARWQDGTAHPLTTVIERVTSARGPIPGAGVPAQRKPLTPRELQVAQMVAQGLSNREIAEKLVLSKRTIDVHVEHILSKFGITSRHEIGARLDGGL
ncbi:LuxR C-terminal-related transcriptional regulator [Streptomyces sp. N35]|uniref:LuxR C-terminal-related transcriptional regulator n=1 Tax=Streptomyces sp. N35 TaxID=2795730 RepID=UPI0018F31FD6|nr:LuxR C-terminal-related transcriptional regulator [Streptomyces sp. N35]